MSVCVNDTDGDGNCAACARNPEAPCRVSARDRLFHLIAGVSNDGSRPWCDEARQLLDEYAHELAEKQREDAFLIEDEDDCCRKYGLALARSIDPEVLNSE